MAVTAGSESCARIAMQCIACGAPVTTPGRNYRCPACGDLLEWKGNEAAGQTHTPEQWQTLWRTRKISSHPLDRSGVWRFRELLPPLDTDQAVTLEEGNTPMYALPRCGEAIGIAALYAKHQGMNPTGSFKDTGMTVAVSAACAAGCGWLACASTGNTSASMAAYAARAGLRSLILVPQGRIAWAKLAQALDYGAVTCQLETDFDGCVRVLDEVIASFAAAVVNSVNPYRLEGQKTVAAEIAEAFDWQVPDHVIVPGGNLANISALGKGFREMQRWGLLTRMPRISVVQAAGANPLVRSLAANGGKELIPVEAETLASAIRIGRPLSWKKAVRVLAETGGTCLDVSEAEIANAKALLGREGIACEPASAAALAGARKLAQQGRIGRHESVVLVLTGHGMKDADFTLAFHRGELPLSAADSANLDPSLRRAPLPLPARADAVMRALEQVA